MPFERHPPDTEDVGESDLDRAWCAGRSTPANTSHSLVYPCTLLVFLIAEQITRTTPRRRTILHLSQIRFTDARTFICSSHSNLVLELRYA